MDNDQFLVGEWTDAGLETALADAGIVLPRALRDAALSGVRANLTLLRQRAQLITPTDENR